MQASAAPAGLDLQAVPPLLAMQVLELDPGNAAAASAVKRLTPTVMERREKLKEEMLGGRPATCNPRAEHAFAQRNFEFL